MPLTKNIYHTATSQLICIEIQLTGFYMVQAFTAKFFRKDFKTAVVPWMHLGQNLERVYVLIMYDSFKSKMFQLFALSIRVVLYLIWHILNLIKLKELLSTLNKSTIWL